MSGSAKRIKDLQAIFNSPDRYGKGLDWTGYTVHDAANILRRYLNQLPEPIIPLEFYEAFRDPLKHHESQAVGDVEFTTQDTGNFDHDGAVTTYQRLITEMPALNRQLLLYILDLLAVFSSKSEQNRMTSANLASIFQPGIISHPDHDMVPQEYRLSQDVLIFLIENQDNFLIGMTGTAIDEKTNKEVQSGGTPPSTSTSNKAAIGRSASNASAGADSLRRYGGVRRNVSVSSRNSKGSTGAHSPVSAAAGMAFTSSSTGAVHRSNTVPSKKSPALSSTRFGKPSEPSTPTPSGMSSSPLVQPPPGPISPQALSSPVNPIPLQASSVTETTIPESPEHAIQNRSDRTQGTTELNPGNITPQAVRTPIKERKISSLFAKSPTLGPSDAEIRQPNKLRKKQKPPGSANVSAQSSQASLHNDSPVTPAFHTPLVSPELLTHSRPDPIASLKPPFAPASVPVTVPKEAEPASDPPVVSDEKQTPEHAVSTLKPPKSREPSLNSHGSVTDHSDFDALDTDPTAKPEQRRHKWRFSSSAKKDVGDSPLVPPPPIGSNQRARSTSSVGSSKPKESFTGDTQPLGTENSSAAYSTVIPYSSTESEPLKDSSDPAEKKGGLFGKLKARMERSKEERKERDAEKERAKSPPRSDAGASAGSRQSLSAFAHDHLPYRGRSMEQPRPGEQTQPQIEENVIVPAGLSNLTPSFHSAPAPTIPTGPGTNTSQVIEPNQSSIDSAHPQAEEHGMTTIIDHSNTTLISTPAASTSIPVQAATPTPTQPPPPPASAPPQPQ